jgi:hypothetical protein
LSITIETSPVGLETVINNLVSAALGVLADQVVPETEQPRNRIGYELGDWDTRDAVRREILAIATELRTKS